MFCITSIGCKIKLSFVAFAKSIYYFTAAGSILFLEAGSWGNRRGAICILFIYDFSTILGINQVVLQAI